MQVQGDNLRGLSTRWRGNVGDEGVIADGGAPYIADLNTPISAPANALLQLRATVRKSSDLRVHGITLDYQKNDTGGWFPVNLLSLPAFMAPAPHRGPPGSNTTVHEDQLQSFPSDVNWRGDPENEAATWGNTSATNVYDARPISGGITRLEHEWSIQLGGSTQLDVDDFLDFRMRDSGDVFEEGYFNTARVNITAIIPPERSYSIITEDPVASVLSADPVARVLSAEPSMDILTREPVARVLSEDPSMSIVTRRIQ